MGSFRAFLFLRGLLFFCHCEEYPPFCHCEDASASEAISVGAITPHVCHCEERSDVAISVGATPWPVVIARGTVMPRSNLRPLGCNWVGLPEVRKKRLLRKGFALPRNDRGNERASVLLRNNKKGRHSSQ